MRITVVKYVVEDNSDLLFKVGGSVLVLTFMNNDAVTSLMVGYCIESKGTRSDIDIAIGKCITPCLSKTLVGWGVHNSATT